MRIPGLLLLSALVLCLAACGGADERPASLSVDSVPAADVIVDGVNHGSTPTVVSVRPGDHEVTLKVDRFAPFETVVATRADESMRIEASLDPLEPSHPSVIRRFAQAHGVDVAPFVPPAITRGGSRERRCAVLLWPSRDLRKESARNFAVEADETYEGDAHLEFRRGRTVLYRESFNPASVTTVRPLPAEVIEHMRVGRKFTWGLYFEDRRRPITTSFRIVKRPAVDRQMKRLEKSRHVARQPQITRDLLKAAVLENNRLYTEALVMNLDIAAAHPSSTQPYRGIVTTLRRLNAESSELWAVVSPVVGGKGSHAGMGGMVSGRNGGSAAGIIAWVPQRQPTSVETPTAGGGMSAPRGMGPGDAGVTPPAQPEQPGTPESGTEVETPSERVNATDAMRAHLAEAERMASEAQQVAESAREEADRAEQAVTEAATTLADAESALAQAEADAQAARDALEQSASPTQEQVDAVESTEAAAQQAREAADAARTQVDEAQQAAVEAAGRASDMERAHSESAARVDDLRRALEGTVPPGTEPAPGSSEGPVVQGAPVPVDPSGQPAPSGTDPVPQTAQDVAQEALNAANERTEAARTAYESAASAVAAAEQAHAADPTEANEAALLEAQAGLEAATTELSQAHQALQAANQALAEVAAGASASQPKSK